MAIYLTVHHVVGANAAVSGRKPCATFTARQSSLMADGPCDTLIGSDVVRNVTPTKRTSGDMQIVNSRFGAPALLKFATQPVLDRNCCCAASLGGPLRVSRT